MRAWWLALLVLASLGASPAWARGKVDPFADLFGPARPARTGSAPAPVRRKGQRERAARPRRAPPQGLLLSDRGQGRHAWAGP